MRVRTHQPAVRDRHQFISPMVTALPRDDKQVTDSVFTETETLVDHGSTVLSDKVVTTKVTVDSSSSQSTPTSSSSSVPSSSTHSVSSTSSSSSQSSSSSAKSSSTTGSGSSSSHSSSSNASLSSSSITLSSSGQAASPSILPTASIHSTATLSSTTGLNPSSSSSSSSSAGDSSLAAKSKSPLSTGAIVGIAAGGGAVIILLLIFIIRKRFLRRKERRINDWLVPDLPSTPSLEKPEAVSPPTVADPVVSRNPSSYSTQRDVQRQYIPPSQAMNARPSQRMAPQPSVRSRPTSYQQQQQQQQQPPRAYRNAPPPMAYNNYGPPPPAPMPPAAPPVAYPASLTPSHGSGNSVSFALVRSAFVPSQADELSIAAGEMVRVLAEYDDGWALCANMRGEQGVVPQECLQRQRAVSPPNARRDDQLAFVSPAVQAQGWAGDPRMPQRGGSQSSAAQNPGAVRY